MQELRNVHQAIDKESVFFENPSIEDDRKSKFDFTVGAVEVFIVVTVTLFNCLFLYYFR